MGVLFGVAVPGLADCEALGDGVFAQPANTVSSLGFVAVGAGVLFGARRPEQRALSLVVGACLIGTGLGSVLYHGPQPAHAELLHDLPIVGLLAAITLHDLRGLVPRLRWLPLLFGALAVLVPVCWFLPGVAPLSAEVLVATIVVLEVTLYGRGIREPVRRDVLLLVGLVVVALALFALGNTRSPFCDPSSVLQFHAGWHLAAAAGFGLWCSTAGVGPWTGRGCAVQPRHDERGVHR
jgi:hypothetical protein